MAFEFSPSLSWLLAHPIMLGGAIITTWVLGFGFRRDCRYSTFVDRLFVRDALARIEQSFPDAISALIAVMEKNDPYLRGHMRRVGALTAQIATELELPESVMHAASHAALLHDLGKLGIPEFILHKPGPLTEVEFDVLKVHPERGYDLVMKSPALHAAAPAIRWHHERLDGSGYPDQIDDTVIPIEARIVAVADVWDALTSDRVYRAAMPTAVAREIMMNEAGTKLDAACVTALMAVLDRLEREAPVSISSGTVNQRGQPPFTSVLAS